MINKEQVLKLGFKELPHFTIGDNLIYDLGRHRHLSLSGLGSCNEFLYIGETLNNDGNIYTDDLVCLSNYDFEGFLTLEKLTVLLSFFRQK